MCAPILKSNPGRPSSPRLARRDEQQGPDQALFWLDGLESWHAPRRREIRTGSEDRSLYTRTRAKKRVLKSRWAGCGAPNFAALANVSPAHDL